MLVPLQQQQPSAPLLDTGIHVLRTPQLPGPSDAWGHAVSDIGATLGKIHAHVQEATDSRIQSELAQRMGEEQLSLQQFQQQEPDESKWMPHAQERVQALRSEFAKQPVSERGRIALDTELNHWGNHTLITTQGASFSWAGKRAIGAADVNADRLAANGQNVDSAYSGLSAAILPQDMKEDRIFRGNERAKAKRWEIATQTAQNTVLSSGDLESAKGMIDQTDMPDFMKDSARLTLERVHKQDTERKTNDSQGKFLGEVLMSRAQGKVFVPEQVDSWVKEGRMDAATGARLRDSFQKEVGSMPGEFEKFLTDKVLTYDPATDPTKKQWAAIQSEALGLNLNPSQAGRYDMLMSQALHGRTDEDKALNYLKTNARAFIDNLHEEGRLSVQWKRSAGDDATNIKLLQQPYALENWGIDPTTADTIRKLSNTDKTQALEMFREASNARTRTKDGQIVTSINPDPLDPNSSKAGLSKLSPWTVKALDDLSKSTKAGEIIDDAARMKSGIQAAELNGRLDHWFDQFKAREKRLPNEKEVQGQMNEMIQPYLHGNTLDIFKGKTPPVPSAQSSGDLSAKLPAGLKPYADTFEAAGRIYGLNPAFLAAVAAHETAGGTSHAFREKRNAMGVSNNSGPIAFDDVRDSILHQAKTLAGKTYGGANDIASIGRIYAPPGAGNDPNNDNPSWPSGVAEWMRKFGAGSSLVRISPQR